MSRKNTSHRKWVFGFTLFLILMTSMPTVLAELSAGDDWVFTGFLFGVQDGNSYIAKMLRGSAGDWLFTTPYTAYPQSGTFAFFPYYLLGKLAAPPGLHDQLVAIFHWLRVGGIVFLVWSLDRFLRFFLGEEEGLVRWGLALATLGGGLGWLYLAGAERLWGGDLPLELYSPESFGFLMLMGLPHLLFARGFLLISIQSILTVSKPSVQQGLKAGIGLLLVGLFQPLTTAAAWAVLAAFCVSVFVWTLLVKLHDLAVRKDVLARAGVAVLVSLPIVLYNLIRFAIDPVLKGWESQNIILSPPFGDYLLAFGLLLPFALAGAWTWLRQSGDQWVSRFYLVVWLACFPLLAYAPHQLQRRLPEGIWVCLVVLGLLFLKDYPRFPRKAALAFVATGFLSTSIFWIGTLFTALNPALTAFRTAEEVELFEGLQALNMSSDTIILAEAGISNPLPAWVPARVLVGHGPESISYNEIAPRVENFFLSSKKEEGWRLIEEFGVDYVIWNEAEYGDFPYESSKDMQVEEVLTAGGFQVLRVDK